MKKAILLILSCLLALTILNSEERKEFYTEKRGFFESDSSSVRKIPKANLTRVKMNTQEQEIDYPPDVYDFNTLRDINYLSNKEKIEYFQLPKTYLKNSSTEGLIETCLNYPLLNTLSNKSYKSLYESFNGYYELKERAELPEKLLEVYRKTTYSSYSKLSTNYKLTVFNYFLSLDEIINLFNIEESMQLLEYAINKPNYPESKEYLIAKILLELEYAEMFNLLQDNDKIKQFVESKSMRMFPPKLISEIGEKYLRKYKNGGKNE